MDRYAIVGAGNVGCAVAAHLKKLGGEVRLYDVAEEQLSSIMENDNTITVTGSAEMAGEARVDLVTMDLSEAVDGADLIICATPAHIHKFVARDLAGLLTPGQILMLNPGRTGGVLEVRKVLHEQGCQADVLVVEAQTVLYACRREGAAVNIFGVKSRVPCAGLPKEDVHRFFELIQPVLPQFVQAESIWHTSLDNIGMLFHPTPTLLNLGRMESGQPFDYYIDGMSPSIAYLIEKLDAERLEVADAVGVKLPTALEWLESSYGATGRNLHEALQNNESYRGIKAPLFETVEDKLTIRYVVEDVPTGLVPFSELGKKFGVETPAIDTVINLADILFDTDFRAKGRNLEQLGLAELTPEEIRGL